MAFRNSRSNGCRHQKGTPYQTANSDTDKQLMDACTAVNYDEHIDRLIDRHSKQLTSLVSISAVTKQYTTKHDTSTDEIWLVQANGSNTIATFMVPGVVIDSHLPSDIVKGDLINSKPESVVQSWWIWGSKSTHFESLCDGINNIVEFLGERAIIGRSDIVITRRDFYPVMKMGRQLFSHVQDTQGEVVEADYTASLEPYAHRGLVHTQDNKIEFYELSESNNSEPRQTLPISSSLIRKKQMVICKVGFKICASLSSNFGGRPVCELLEVHVEDRQAYRYKYPNKRRQLLDKRPRMQIDTE
ncbi:hypothetical protein CPB86DRAFT_820079 [Serendipita vermifera]|nr:hypothetical protein CPB86DRAFT_820079 [Serendipita vermifera]